MPRVKLFGGLRRLTGASSVSVRGTTVREVLQGLCSSHAELCQAIWDEKQLHPHVRIMVAGHDIEMRQGLDTTVTADDEIAIFPPMAGGVN